MLPLTQVELSLVTLLERLKGQRPGPSFSSWTAGLSGLLVVTASMWDSVLLHLIITTPAVEVVGEDLSSCLLLNWWLSVFIKMYY